MKKGNLEFDVDMKEDEVINYTPILDILKAFNFNGPVKDDILVSRTTINEAIGLNNPEVGTLIIANMALKKKSSVIVSLDENDSGEYAAGYGIFIYLGQAGEKEYNAFMLSMTPTFDLALVAASTYTFFLNSYYQNGNSEGKSEETT